ncbi:MAG: methyltransferase domain-containing protein [Longimicrobiales bacterium]|nr:methyltransferase domain-containing protein [Longimicrobiales bacterium]
MILLTAPHARAIREAADAGETAVVASVDLGRSRDDLALEDGTVWFPDGQSLRLDALERVTADPDAVFMVMDDELAKVTWFAPETNKVYTLRATGGWPALEISGILMHRIKDTDPKADAESKIATIAPVRGHGLETCCGLGYSAILGARTADRVTAFEIDPEVLRMTRLNPYSRPLWEEGGKIEVRNEDVVEAIVGLPDARFDYIVHDPPTLAVAGDLYGDEFYRQLLRVLRPGGRLFHYTGDPGSRSRGQNLPGSVKQRLAALGFTAARLEPGALGVSARKP